MHRIDDYLIDRVFQPICDALYHRVGDCVVIGQSCLMGSIGFVLVGIVWRILMHIAGQLYGPSILLSMSVVSNLFVLGGLGLLYFGYRFYAGRSGPSPLRLKFFLLRGFMLFWFVSWTSCVLTIVSILANVDTMKDMFIDVMRDLLLLCSLYFVSCSNRPPMKLYWQQRHA